LDLAAIADDRALVYEYTFTEDTVCADAGTATYLHTMPDAGPLADDAPLFDPGGFVY
jgi:hypothetical protein